MIASWYLAPIHDLTSLKFCFRTVTDSIILNSLSLTNEAVRNIFENWYNCQIVRITGCVVDINNDLWIESGKNYVTHTLEISPNDGDANSLKLDNCKLGIILNLLQHTSIKNSLEHVKVINWSHDCGEATRELFKFYNFQWELHHFDYEDDEE